MSTSLKKLWLENFVGPDGLCVLCENSGFVQTEHGKYFCICPNGRSLKRQLGLPKPTPAFTTYPNTTATS